MGNGDMNWEEKFWAAQAAAQDPQYTASPPNPGEYIAYHTYTGGLDQNNPGEIREANAFINEVTTGSPTGAVQLEGELGDWINSAQSGSGVIPTGEMPLLPFSGYDPSNPGAIWFPGLDIGRVTDTNYTRTGPFNAAMRYNVLEGSGVEEVDPNYYVNGDQARFWNSYSPEFREILEQKMLDAGLLVEGGYIPGAKGFEQHSAWANVLSMANYLGIGPSAALEHLVKLGQAARAAAGGRGSGAGPSTAYTIPDYESIAQQSKDMFRSMFGHRDPQDWELSMVADYMQQQYRSAADTQIQARLAGNGEFEMPDPTLKTKAYIEDTWDNELSRLRDVESTAATHNMLISAATGGARLMGS